ncbi:MAG: hypothetical protein MJZ15_10825 [Bacteroidales bacterium]|nr:hypothetical protein [Bacteroidales bacterium]
MNKIFAFVAFAIVAIAGMTSCATREQKDAIAMKQAIDGDDVQTVVALAEDLYGRKETLDAEAGYALVCGLNYLVMAKGEDKDLSLGYVQKVIEVYELVAGNDADGLAKVSQLANVDFAPIVEQYKAALAQIEAVADTSAIEVDE